MMDSACKTRRSGMLAEVRGNRDFQLQQFLEGILKESALLVWSGTGGVPFAYRGLQ